MIKQVAGAYTVGDPNEEATGVGPLASEKQWERVNGYIERGIADGATLVFGGPGRIPGLEHGAYIRPTVFADVDPDSAIAQEEIFGPVLAVIPYTGEEEAVAIANNSIYGRLGSRDRIRPHPRGGGRRGETADPGSGRVADQRRCTS
jgi:aldehyde dehydrogenase (NAD+)